MACSMRSVGVVTNLESREPLYLKYASSCKHPHPYHRDDGVDEGEAVDKLEIKDGQHSFVGKDDPTADPDIESAIYNWLDVGV